MALLYHVLPTLPPFEHSPQPKLLVEDDLLQVGLEPNPRPRKTTTSITPDGRFGGLLSHGGTPGYHPAIVFGFSMINNEGLLGYLHFQTHPQKIIFCWSYSPLIVPIILHYIWVNYNDLTSRPNPGIMLNMGNHPQMALFQASEVL